MNIVIRGVMTGALVGGILAVIAGGSLGGVLGSLASLTSLGSPTMVRNETLRWAGYGALAGIALGSVVGAIITVVVGKVHGAIVGAAAGAVVLALGGMLFGSITSNDAPVNTTRVIALSSFGVVVGIVTGAVLGWVINLLAGHFLKILGHSLNVKVLRR